MASKAVFLNRFNETAEQFCKDLVSTFPEVNEFKQLKSGLMLLKNVNEKQPRELFQKYVASHFKDQIMSKDEHFIMDLHNHEVLSGEVSQWDTILDLLRPMWSTLSQDNKETIWKYFQVLIAINDRYLSQS